MVEKTAQDSIEELQKRNSQISDQLEQIGKSKERLENELNEIEQNSLRK